MLPHLPELTRFYGIQPADLENFTLREVSEYRTRLQQIKAEGGNPWQAPGR